MTWREKMVCKILLAVAQVVAGEPTLVLAIQRLSNEISVNATKGDS